MSTRVLLVDDSPFVLQLLEKGLSQASGIEVIGTAKDPFDARDKIVDLKPDVMTLDIEMPRMNGVDFLKRLMIHHPMPVIMVSGCTSKGGAITLEALRNGAIDFVAKPTGMQSGLDELVNTLIDKIRIASKINMSQWYDTNKEPVLKKVLCTPNRMKLSEGRIIAFGASTGGTEALATVLESLPDSMPGIVLTQHMPENFTKLFAERLDRDCVLECKEAEDGDVISPGRVLVAPGGRQMRVLSTGQEYIVRCERSAPVSGHCPSVDVLFDSVARFAGKKALGIIMTGMGQDGARGLLKIKESGGRTLGQSRSTCVVYGMPAEAMKIGAVEKEIDLDDISSEIISLLSELDKE